MKFFEEVSSSIKNLFAAGDTGIAENLVMEQGMVDSYNATRNIVSPKTFCYAPSLNMYFSQNGEVKVCCHNSEFTIGTYPQQSIKEIWHSDKANELRDYMRKYDLSHGCGVCEYDMKLGAYNEVRARYFDLRPRHHNYPTMMEFLISNKCNLECVMCFGEYSSLIRKNREHLPPLHFPYDKSFVHQLEEFIPFLHEARFSGSGEAFLIDLNYEIWEMIIRLNPKCVIMVQTNGTALTDKAKDILQRGNFQIGVSLDSLSEETYETIRVNAQFDKVMENVRYLSDYCRQRKSYFMLALCVMRQNWDELPAFIGFCNEMNAAAVLHKVWSPAEFALHYLPSADLQRMYSQLSAFAYLPQNPLEKQNLEHFNYFVSVIKNWAGEAALKEESQKKLDGISPTELLVLTEQKVKTYIDQTIGDGSEKDELFETYRAKLGKVLARFTENDRQRILQMIYFENPARVVRPVTEQPEEALLESIAKMLVGK